MVCAASHLDRESSGTIFTVNAWRHDALEVPHSYSQLRFWRHTSVTDLSRGEKRVMKPGLLGHEWDEDLDNGHRPAGLVRLSETTVNNVWMIQDYGANYDSGTATHHLVIYRSVSGSLVFGAGTVQWSWGLDPVHDTETGIPPDKASPTNIRVGVDQMGAEPDIQQATLNLFCDMGVMPGVETLGPGLVRPEQSTDHTPPVVTSVDLSSDVILVRAGDDDGLVAAVEFMISGDGVWHPAESTTDPNIWRIPIIVTRVSESLGYNFKHGDNNITVRSVDDSYNIGDVLETTVNIQ